MAGLWLLVVDRCMLKAITLCRCLLVLILARLWLLILGRSMLKVMALRHCLLVLQRFMLILTVACLSFLPWRLPILTMLRVSLMRHPCHWCVLRNRLLLPAGGWLEPSATVAGVLSSAPDGVGSCEASWHGVSHRLRMQRLMVHGYCRGASCPSRVVRLSLVGPSTVALVIG